MSNKLPDDLLNTEPGGVNYDEPINYANVGRDPTFRDRQRKALTKRAERLSLHLARVLHMRPGDEVLILETIEAVVDRKLLDR